MEEICRNCLYLFVRPPTYIFALYIYQSVLLWLISGSWLQTCSGSSVIWDHYQLTDGFINHLEIVFAQLVATLHSPNPNLCHHIHFKQANICKNLWGLVFYFVKMIDWGQLKPEKKHSEVRLQYIKMLLNTLQTHIAYNIENLLTFFTLYINSNSALLHYCI